jgi:ribosome-associated protein
MLFTIPDDELTFRATRASGPGGQHVNKASTKIEVLWDVSRSAALSDTQRQRISDKLSNRIDGGGVLRVTAGARRSQLQNRMAAVERLNDLVRQALAKPKPRKQTKVPKRTREERLAEKKRRSETKQQRKPVEDE